MKKCSFCKQNKELTEFYNDKRKLDGKYVDCKQCRKRFKSVSTEAQKKKMRVWRSINLEKRILASVKCRAKKKNIPFNLDVSDIKIPEFCPVLGIKIKPKITNINDLTSTTTPLDSSPSIDRIDPLRGYVKGNVVIISHRANYIKNAGTIKEHEMVINYMKNYQNKA